MCTQDDVIMLEVKAVHYSTESVIVSSKCTTLKHTVPGVINMVIVTFNHATVSKLTGAVGSHTSNSNHKCYSLVACYKCFTLISLSTYYTLT